MENLKIQFTYNTRNGNYYAFTSEDMKDRVIYEDENGYYFKKGKKVFYINKEGTARLNSFRAENA